MTAKEKGQLYLIPTKLGNGTNEVIPDHTKSIACQLSHFIVEKEKSARRFLKELGCTNYTRAIFYPLDKHTTLDEIHEYIQLIAEGNSFGILSEAGAPCIADPGALVVELAHQYEIKVIPLVGPSSVTLALTASGMNGQNFAFWGYLPIKENERRKKIQQLEKLSLQYDQTQIFIETPYRNNQLIKDILKTCRKETRLCIACDLTLPSEFIKTQPIEKWQKANVDIHKRPVVFLIYAH